MRVLRLFFMSQPDDEEDYLHVNVKHLRSTTTQNRPIPKEDPVYPSSTFPTPAFKHPVVAAPARQTNYIKASVKGVSHIKASKEVPVAKASPKGVPYPKASKEVPIVKASREVPVFKGSDEVPIPKASKKGVPFIKASPEVPIFKASMKEEVFVKSPDRVKLYYEKDDSVSSFPDSVKDFKFFDAKSKDADFYGQIKGETPILNIFPKLAKTKSNSIK
ncbi:unnamed protein product [Allacma fusca]|uniref:Uncharacterized protein n=1 Tax=Allacma fusca TaxID=39272 RepID=A0A8J2K8Y3_9HEXA|nr:unnamed protein product [Allacma fusca]